MGAAPTRHHHAELQESSQSFRVWISVAAPLPSYTTDVVMNPLECRVCQDSTTHGR